MRLPWSREREELDREVAFHIETLADSFEAEGLGRNEALVRARKEFGGVDQIKEECRDVSGWNWLAQLLQDLRFGWRMMRKAPSTSLAAIASLALGVGATTAIFSFAHAVLWRSMPVPNPEQLLEVYWEAKSRLSMVHSSSGTNFTDGGLRVADFFSKPAYESMRERSTGAVELAAFRFPQPVSASFGSVVAVARLRGVSENFFPLLRVKPAAGRLLSGPDDEPAIVVSYGFWERYLGRDPRVIGQTMRVNNIAYAIAGVLPREFFGLAPGDNTELYTAIRQTPAYLAPDGGLRVNADDPFRWWLQMIARRREGVPIEQTRAVLNAAFASTWPARPTSEDQTPRIRLVDARHGLGGAGRQLGEPVWTLLILVCLVQLIACANIANLLLARATAREREMAMRVSLGCGSARLMRQFLTESLLLAAIGGALGLGVALALGSIIGGVFLQDLPADSLIPSFNADLLAIAAAVTLITGLLFGVYPAWKVSHVSAAPALKEGAGSAGTLSRRRLAPARILVFAQVALSVILLTAAIVFTSHVHGILSSSAGFERAHTLLFDLRPGEIGYKGERLAAFYREVEERLRTVPGVAEVGLSRIRPMHGGGRTAPVSSPETDKQVGSAIQNSTAGFPAALGVRLAAGRFFTAEEVRRGQRVALVSEQLARELNLASPLGARIRYEAADWEVVGVVRDASYANLKEARPVAYLPLAPGADSLTVLLRTHADPLSFVGAAREAVHSIERRAPLVDVYTMEQQISLVLQRERMVAWLCGAFAALALVLCAVGLYGLMSHVAARRTTEIGIRMALGASGGAVMREVIGDGMRLVVAGVTLGAPLALYVATLAQKQNFLPKAPLPYWTLAAAIGVLLASALAAVFGPALRAASVDPMRTLREG
jgi:predicted permease